MCENLSTFASSRGAASNAINEKVCGKPKKCRFLSENTRTDHKKCQKKRFFLLNLKCKLKGQKFIDDVTKNDFEVVGVFLLREMLTRRNQNR